MADRVRKVLDHIVAQYVVRDEQKDIDLNAAAAEPGDAIASEKRQAARREGDRADDLADAFRQGLLLAYRSRAAGQPEIALDDRDPAEDRIADALIRFLVSFELAASRTEESEPMHYVYHVAVDWDRLVQVAHETGVDLDEALRQLADSA